MTGEYYLRGVMETASGFKVNPDSTFEFFLSYGALDRYGSGKWTVKDNEIIFNSAKKHGQDFELISSRKTNDNSITIKITEKNEMLQSHVYCMLKPGDDKDGMMTNKSGEAKLSFKKADSVSLIFEFVPERISTFPLTSKKHNYFEFKFQPWIFEVYFENFSLNITDEGLTGGHPLMDGNNFKYEK
ncbi:MAG: hypothetical protein ABUT20_29915 [Bacteroidota bacterium]